MRQILWFIEGLGQIWVEAEKLLSTHDGHLVVHAHMRCCTLQSTYRW